MSRAVLLTILIACVGQTIVYGMAVWFARRLGPAGFEAYVIGASVFLLLLAIAPMGIEKYALRRLPALLERRDLPAARRFMVFAARRVLATATGLAAIGLAALWFFGGISPPIRQAIGVGIIALPAAALVHVGLEMLAASGREVVATALLRVAVPATVLLGFGLIASLPGQPSGAGAVGAWTLAWYLFVPVLAVAVFRSMPAGLWRAGGATVDPLWSQEAVVFWVHRVAIAAMAQAGVIALELLSPSPLTVASYAAALATVSPAVAMIAATNRLYARQLAIGLERGDWNALAALRRTRLLWLVPVVLAFAAGVIAFAPALMGLFGPEYIAEGVPALRILAAGAALSMILALAPTYLKFTRQQAPLLWAVIAAAILQVALLALLIPRLGAAGAAAAHAVTTVALYGTLALVAHRQLRASAREGGA